MVRLNGKAIGAVLFALYLGACVTLQTTRTPTSSEDRGLKFPHGPHVEAAEMECTMCHDFTSEDPMQVDHNLCSVCHDIPEDNPTEESCSVCHTRDDYSVDPRPSSLLADVKFDHGPHVAQEIECATCHADPETQVLPEGRLKPFCMDCHGETRPELNTCSVCHEELSKDTIPKTRDGVRIAHDSPEIWEHVHGREARMDRAYCAQCHSEEQDCDQCHRAQKPDNHTAAWRRKIHGIQASWDRQNCATCHEESSCLQCHQNTKPTSHRGRFGAPANNHCVQCHYPPEQNNCTVCHEEIAHRQAKPSPHIAGIYPPDCARCHPGGLPTRAPHLTNSSVRCIVCHK